MPNGRHFSSSDSSGSAEPCSSVSCSPEMVNKGFPAAVADFLKSERSKTALHLIEQTFPDCGSGAARPSRLNVTPFLFHNQPVRRPQTGPTGGNRHPGDKPAEPERKQSKSGKHPSRSGLVTEEGAKRKKERKINALLSECAHCFCSARAAAAVTDIFLAVDNKTNRCFRFLLAGSSHVYL